MTCKRTHFRNHYVPAWYQKRFLGEGTQFHYLDLAPEVVANGSTSHTRRAIRRLGPKHCFVQPDLYTTRWGEVTNEDIEKFFFGKIDDQAPISVDFVENFDIRAGLNRGVTGMLEYLSVQKIRTPRGLRSFASMANLADPNDILLEMQAFRQMNCAIFCDAVWQIASAERSPTKFILSDNPVTHYNQAIFPNSQKYSKGLFPDIRQVGTQTMFPLSQDKILILTNLAWIRNTYQSALAMHPNPRLFRQTVFNGTDVQIGRLLSETEVRKINYITKSMADRYVAAADKDWLFPEAYLKSLHWSSFGRDHLLLPDPRCIHMGGEIYVGYGDGSSDAFGPYAHRPWENKFKDEKRSAREWKTLTKIQGEFRRRYGEQYRGCAVDWIRISEREMVQPG